MLVQRRNIFFQDIMEFLEANSAADQEQFRLRRQKRFLKSSTSTCWEGDCQRPAHVRRQVCEDLQNIRGNPREVISLYPFLFCGRRLYRTCEEACPHPQIFIAIGDDFNTLANLFRVEHSTVRTIICEVVKFPSMDEDFYKPDIC